MKKSIEFKEKLINSIECGDKTQTVRVIKANPLDNSKTIERSLELHKFHKAKDYESYPVLQELLNRCKYRVGDTLNINGSSVKLEITKMSINRMRDLDYDQLKKEGLASFPSPKIKNSFTYYDYIENQYSCISLYESYTTLMHLCYGFSVVVNNPFVFVYEFKIVE